ncbi:MAG: Tad domain-containing protein, partial [Paracoccaceae bacterium]
MLLFGLFILILMLWAGGMAIDAMRVEATRTQLQNTLDRAVLAAADLDQSLDAKSVVEDYFDKAGLAQYLDADSITVDSTRANNELSFRRVSATANAEVKSMFMQMLGIDSMIAASSGTAEEGITDLEISLILDVSGSMGSRSSSGNSKIYELRQAAKDFVYYMQCNPNASRGSGAACTVQPDKVSISLVPYSEQVTAGATLLDEMNVTDEHSYSHCVTFQQDQFLTPEIDPDTPLKRTGHFDPWSNYNSGYYSSNPYAYDNNRTCRLDSWREIRPFVADYHELENRIDDLSAGGNTSIDVGMKWGSALLDPSTRDTIEALTAKDDGSGSKVVDPAFWGRPYDYTQDYSMKVIVLMTDGVNTDQHYLKPEYRSGPSPFYRNTEETDHYSIYNPDRDQYYYPF